MDDYRDCFTGKRILPGPTGYAAFCRIAVATLLSLAGTVCSFGQSLAPTNTLSDKQIDYALTREWVDGHAINTNLPAGQNLARSTIATLETSVGWIYFGYGASTNPGPRHLLTAFKQSIPCATVVMAGNGTVSAAAAVVPDIVDDEGWTNGHRLAGKALDVADSVLPSLSVWNFPQGGGVRALRFSHTAEASEGSYQGSLAGALLLAGQWVNLAPQASITANGDPVSVAALLTPDLFGQKDWCNSITGRIDVITPDKPETILLAWPAKVSLGGLILMQAGVGQIEVQQCVADAAIHPRAAGEQEWQTIGVYTNLVPLNHSSFAPSILSFGNNFTTRGIRLLLQKPLDEKRFPNLVGTSLGGRKVFLSKILAMSSADGHPLEDFLPSAACTPPAPIPISFTMPFDGYATLVVERSDGVRLRNLVSETHFKAGPQTVYWDGRIERQGITSELVEPGSYRLRGLVRGELDLTYEFTVGSAGNPVWYNGRQSAGWLADHRPPADVLFLPGTDPSMVIASEVSEVGQALVWTDLDGNKKFGYRALYNGFYCASHLTRDLGAHAVTNVSFYSAMQFKKEIWISSHTANGLAKNFFYWKAPSEDLAGVAGLAVRDGLVYFANQKTGQLLIIDSVSQKVLSTNSLPSPRGIVFDASGALFAISQGRVLRFQPPANGMSLGDGQVVVETGLEDPRRIALASDGTTFVSDWGTSHQVKVFSSAGVPLRTVGHAGSPVAGPYDPLHMNYPCGMSVDSKGNLWVAEYDNAPKRVSVWDQAGNLVRSMEGPSKYAGGGRVDPVEPSRFYYSDIDDNDPIPYQIGLEYELDWATGGSFLKNVYYRRYPATNDLFARWSVPETSVRTNGAQYMLNTANASATGGAAISAVWKMEEGIARPVSAIGLVAVVPEFWKEPWLAKWPKGSNGRTGQDIVFVWSDTNDNREMDPDEVVMFNYPNGLFHTSYDLSVLTTYGMLVKPIGFTPGGAPLYDFTKGEQLVTGVVPTFGGSGGAEMLWFGDGEMVQTGGPVRGYKGGRELWSYTDFWYSLHASHSAPLASKPGELIGTTKSLSLPFTVQGGEAGKVWALNGNLGNIYLFTSDGLFIGTLFHDVREGRTWSMPSATRGMRVNDVSLYDESFQPSIQQMADGTIYLVVGKNHSSIVRLDGLKSVRRLPASEFQVTAQQLGQTPSYLAALEDCRRELVGAGVVPIAQPDRRISVDGRLEDWNTNRWARIDDRTSAGLAVIGSNLFAGFITGDAQLLTNAATDDKLLFKFGGALDLMLGTHPDAEPNRQLPVAGDLRLLVTRVRGVTKAMLYRAVTGGEGTPALFSSPLRTVSFADVRDVSGSVELAGTNGNFEFRVPLAVLGLDLLPGRTLSGDLGVLRGAAGVTVQRTYWQNKAAGLVSDIPSEAELQPRLWGRLFFETSSIPALRWNVDLLPPRLILNQPFVLDGLLNGGWGVASWTLVGGTLPPGMQMDAVAGLSGTPTAAGDFEALVQARDEVGSLALASLRMVVIESPLGVVEWGQPTVTLKKPTLQAVVTVVRSRGTDPLSLQIALSSPMASLALSSQTVSWEAGENGPKQIDVNLASWANVPGLIHGSMELIKGGQDVELSRSGFCDVWLAPEKTDVWRVIHFLTEADLPVSANDADPDGDGLSNLVEYALGSDPLVAQPEQVPVTVWIQDNGLLYLGLEFHAQSDAVNVSYQLEVSDNLVDWRTSAVFAPPFTSNPSTVKASVPGSSRRLVRIRDDMPVTENGMRFLRLNVVEAP